MSRTNPYKQKRRQAKQSILVYVEGLHEENILKHLRALYTHESGKNIKIVRGSGGSADTLITHVIREIGDYDKRVIIFDNDKPRVEMDLARKNAKNNNITIIENTPCLEALLLTILKPSTEYSRKSSSWCKKTFQDQYIDYRSHPDHQTYVKIFPKTLLDKQRLKVLELDKILTIIS